MNIPRCKKHSRQNPRSYQSRGCDGCKVEQQALLAIAQKRNRTPRTLRRKSRAFHAAGGGTYQFDIRKYDRLMEAR